MDKLPPGRLLVFICVVAGSLALDLWTKQAVFDALGLGGHTDWMLNSWVRFRLQPNLNQGAPWGKGQGFAPGFAALSGVAFAGILYWLFVSKAARSLWLTIALAFVSGGTLGNLYDRLGLHGVRLPGATEPALAVRDFLHFQFGTFDWAIFNVADICLVTGAVMLMLQSLMSPETEERGPARGGFGPAASAEWSGGDFS